MSRLIDELSAMERQIWNPKNQKTNAPKTLSEKLEGRGLKMNKYVITSVANELQITNDAKNPTFVGTFIVAAESEEKARQFATNYAGEELKVHADAWTNPALSVCKLVGEVAISRPQLMALEFCSESPIFAVNGSSLAIN